MLAKYTKVKEKRARVAEVTSAVPLTKKEQLKIERWVHKSVGEDVKFTSRVNPGVIAGLKVRAGDWLYDGTFQGELERVRQVLIEG